MGSSRTLILFLFIILILSTCSSSKTQVVPVNSIQCSDEFCHGKYVGPEFINGSDVAHQFSNTMSSKVGDKLKELYRKGFYSKVDFQHIVMSTEGMGTGNVEYYLKVPFARVSKKCDAFTSFDHVGGWNHKPALSRRQNELNKLLLYGDSFNISQLCKTKEGLQEYWIQWRNNVVQKDCAINEK